MLSVAAAMALVLLALCCAAPAGAVTSSPTARVKHDILMLAVDDMRNEQAFYGCEYMKTPNMGECARVHGQIQAAVVQQLPYR